MIFKRLNSTLQRTSLYALHKELGATLVPFAGFEMPIKYAAQTHIQSHNWTREHTGLFDVSHMMQSTLSGSQSTEFLHKVTPTDFSKMQINTGSLSVLLNENGGIVDDTLITREAENQYYVVTNAGCIEQDLVFFNNEIKNFDAKLTKIDASLLALQGPTAQQSLQKFVSEDLSKLYFGSRTKVGSDFGELGISRTGYTGEDGFEVSVGNDTAEKFARALLQDAEVQPIGLAARDSLRLEAGLCLYGNELNTEITPIEAALSWVVSKSRRTGDDKFNGFDKIIDQLTNKTHKHIRVGFKYAKGPAARTGSKIFNPENPTEEIGWVTSGSASPSLGGNVGQCYLKRKFNKKGNTVLVQVRNKMIEVEIAKMPFVEAKYYRG